MERISNEKYRDQLQLFEKYEMEYFRFRLREAADILRKAPHAENNEEGFRLEVANSNMRRAIRLALEALNDYTIPDEELKKETRENYAEY